VVRSGPFQGMKYTSKSAGSVLIPKLLGIYERELHPVLEYAISHPFQVIVDIGAAEVTTALDWRGGCRKQESSLTKWTKRAASS